MYVLLYVIENEKMFYETWLKSSLAKAGYLAATL